MQRRQAKFVFAVGRITTAIIAVVLLGSAYARAQISPGALSQAHSSLEGATHCVDCHDVGQRPPLFKCLECHKEIRRRLEESRGLHPSLVGTENPGLACVKCHPDHNGRDFKLIRWDPPQQEFDHRRAGFTLAGKHATIACQDCHRPSHIAAESAGSILMKDRTRTFLGLGRECRSCHDDAHHGQFQAQCDTCHNTGKWQDALRYDHAKSRYPLEGLHEKVDCRKCHTDLPDEKPYRKYRDFSFADCTPCHTDPHRGAFTNPCKTCHAPTGGWKPSGVAAVFDHARTKFPLSGKHAPVACKSCHRKSDFKQPVAHERCLDCHLPSPHKAQFADRPDAGECSACHTVAGFKPATFDLARHRSTRYPLEGRHAGVRCDQCHTPRGADTVYRFPDSRCAACHKDIHAGQFRQQPYGNQCESCHTVIGFRPSTFTLARHQSGRFPLSGAHGAVVCHDCHQNMNATTPVVLRFRFDSLTCSTCHKDLHRGQFAARMAQPGRDGASSDCRACHNAVSWPELPGFDHAKTSFVLKGSHRQMACERCHQPNVQKPDWGSVVFNTAPQQCAGCHEDQHAGQFAAAGATDCTRCHAEQKWKPSLFDHNAGKGYQLTGAHSNKPCAGCHYSKTEPDGKTVVVYRGVPRTCAACHDKKVPEDIVHP